MSEPLPENNPPKQARRFSLNELAATPEPGDTLRLVRRSFVRGVRQSHYYDANGNLIAKDPPTSTLSERLVFVAQNGLACEIRTIPVGEG